MTGRHQLRQRRFPFALGFAALATSALGILMLQAPRPASAPVASRTPAANSMPGDPCPDRGSSTNSGRDALEAYTRGSYAEAERAAAPIAERGRSSPDPAVRKQGARARWVMGFAAARRKDFPAARQRFAQLREEAAALPDHGRQEALPGEHPPTLEEEGAYEHAVLTAALAATGEAASDGELSPAAAEREFVRFIHDYPESPLVHAAVLRIERLHGGNLPPAAESVWREARQVALARQAERERQEALCGPEVLAEVLRRSSRPAAVEALARELKTDGQGTSLKMLLEAARAHGFQAEGLHLSPKGLRRQWDPALPGGPARYVLALLKPGHYVLVEAARYTTVTVWDPDRDGPGQGGTRELSAEAWVRSWSGAALVLR